MGIAATLCTSGLVPETHNSSRPWASSMLITLRCNLSKVSSRGSMRVKQVSSSSSLCAELELEELFSIGLPESAKAVKHCMGSVSCRVGLHSTVKLRKLLLLDLAGELDLECVRHIENLSG